MAFFHISDVTFDILVAFTLFSTLYFAVTKLSRHFAQRRFQRENNCQPLYSYVPIKDPILGLDEVSRMFKRAEKNVMLESFAEAFDKYGRTHGKRVLGKNLIMTSEPENVKTVLSLRFKDYSFAHRLDNFAPLLGRGIFNSDGELWAHSRALIRPNFAREQVADLSLFENLIQDFFARIPKDGSAFDVQDLFFQFTMDSATEFLFGRSVHTLRQNANLVTPDSLDGQFAQAFKTSLEGCVFRFRIGFFRKFIKPAKFTAADRICHAYADQFVDEAVQHRQDLEKGLVKDTNGKYVFLYELAKATQNKQQLRDELLNIMLAGRDTTASLLSALFFQLARRPDVYAKLRREVAEALNGRLPDYEQLKNMKYVKYCLNEALRLYPPVPANNRYAEVDTVLPTGGGPDGKSPLFVPAGSTVGWQPYIIHRRTDLFGADAEAFRPERWETLKPGWEYLPFNGGPRICIGQQYALTEAGYVLTRIVQAFERIEAVDPGARWREGLALTMCVKGGVHVRFWPVEKTA